MAEVARQDRHGTERKDGGAKECCKTFSKFIFSHIGLCGMVVLYSVIGGFTFQYLEQTNEKQLCIEAENAFLPMEAETVQNLWVMSKAFYSQYESDGMDPEVQGEALDAFHAVLQQFRDDTLELGYDGKNCSMMGEVDGPGYQWSFPGSLLFSVTVITTIGACVVACYGNYLLHKYESV